MRMFLGRRKRTDTGFLGPGERAHAGAASLSAEPFERTQLLCLRPELNGNEYAFLCQPWTQLVM